MLTEQPENAFVLTAAGMLCAVVWIASPRRVVAAVTAGVLLASGAAGLVALPISRAGLFLVLLAAASLVAEVLAPTRILHAAAGGVCLGLAGVSLTGLWSGVHPAVAAVTSTAVGLGAWRAGRRSDYQRWMDPLATSHDVIGRIVIVLEASGNRGQAVVGGELWDIHDPRQELLPGHAVRVLACTGEELVVAPSAEPLG